MIFRETRILFSSVGRHWRTKLACHAAVGAWIALFYYGPQVWPLFATRPAPMLAWDDWIPFQPAWALVYQSVFIVHTLALWVPGNREAVMRYAFKLAAVFACGAVVFWLYPTLSPRPDHSGSFLHDRLISSVDGPRNAFPSLHAAMGLLAVFTVCGHLRACRISPRWRRALAVWWIALLYSTLATRQHRLPDLLAGICLGLISSALPRVATQTQPRHDSLPPNPHRSPVL